MSAQVLVGWCLYRLYDAAGELLYVGQTRRAAVARWAEHLRDQPWAHEIVTMQADPTMYGSERDVLIAERSAIHAEQPIYNGTHNYRNPHRVVVQRSTRPPSHQSLRPAAPRRLTYWQRWAIAVPAGWLLATLVLWLPLRADHPGWSGVKLAAVLTTIGAVGLWMVWPKRRRQRARW